MVSVYNRVGGLFWHLARLTGIESQAALAVWAVESSSADFRRGHPILRFENHILFSRWGKDNEASFDAHFQFGGRNGISGNRWEQHRFRLSPGDEWRKFHGDQAREYEVFNLAARLASREIACQSASFGGPQIMGFNHDVIGYRSATELWKAFSTSERWHVFGFFDFCKSKDLIDTIRQKRWHDFASVYNGVGNANVYAEKIARAYAEACELSR